MKRHIAITVNSLQLFYPSWISLIPFKNYPNYYHHFNIILLWKKKTSLSFLMLCIMPPLHPISFHLSLFFLMWTIFIKSYCSIYLYFYRNHTQYSQVTVLQSGQEQDKASTLMEPNYRKSAEFKGSDPILRGHYPLGECILHVLRNICCEKFPMNTHWTMYTDCKWPLFSQDHLMFAIKSVSTLSNIQILSRVKCCI